MQPTGAYHYHGLPRALLAARAGAGGEKRAVQLGWAADGFPIYGPWGMGADGVVRKLKPSYRLRSGNRPGGAAGPGGAHSGAYTQDWEYAAGSGDLDECNGRTGATPEFPAGTYHYVIAEEYPFVPRLFKGTPDPTFERRGPPPGGKGKGKRPPPPPEDR